MADPNRPNKAPPNRRGPLRLSTIVFAAAVSIVVLFWIAGQASTLRWQMRRLLTHQPEVERQGETGG